MQKANAMASIYFSVGYPMKQRLQQDVTSDEDQRPLNDRPDRFQIKIRYFGHKI